MYHVISTSSSFFRKKTTHLNMQSWKFVFRLPAIGEVGDEILFGFSFRPLKSRDRLVATDMTGALQQGVCWGSSLLSG
jgi:hypothetical protein